jgi:hypothetical protein
MNYIKALERANDVKFETLKLARAELNELLVYLTTDKFASVDNDYVHITTDLLPKLYKLRNTLNPSFGDTK